MSPVEARIGVGAHVTAGVMTTSIATRFEISKKLVFRRSSPSSQLKDAGAVEYFALWHIW
eukprot:3376131-Pleurochrysis_carterae.AAC.3